MIEIKALEKLRAAGRNMAKGRNLENHEECNLLLVIADEIQGEVDERFIERPALEDGIINVGDKICSTYDGEDFIRTVTALIWDKDWDDGRWDFEFDDEVGDSRDCCSISDFYENSRHVKPDSLKELLSDAALAIIDVSYQNVPTIGNVPKLSVDDFKLDEWLEENSERIRELMKEGGDD